MIKKQILNEEILKSIESSYVFSNEPINRFKKSVDPENIKLQLENLKKKISLIDNCDLKKNSNKMVFSDGNFNSQLMIVGEGPGEKEDEIGKPFVGDAGNLLNKMLYDQYSLHPAHYNILRHSLELFQNLFSFIVIYDIR